MDVMPWTAFSTYLPTYKPVENMWLWLLTAASPSQDDSLTCNLFGCDTDRVLCKPDVYRNDTVLYNNILQLQYHNSRDIIMLTKLVGVTVFIGRECT